MIALLGLLASEPPEAPEIEIRQAQPLPIVVHTPSQETGPISTSQILATLSEEITTASILVPRELSGDIVKDCRAAFACVFRHPAVLELEASSSIAPAHLIWVSNLTTRSDSQLRFQLVDMHAAVVAARTTTVADLELHVLERAVVASTERTTVGSMEDLRRLVGSFVREALAPRAAAAGQWGRSGVVRLSSNVAPLTLELDGLFKKEVPSLSARLTAVPAGTRTFSLHAAEYEKLEVQLRVNAGEEADLRVHLLHTPTVGMRVRSGLYWGGVGATVAGIAAVSTGLILSEPKSVCLVSHIGLCSPLGPGKPFVSAGAGLFVGGLSAWLGAAFFGEEYEWPWIGIASGVVLGVGSGLLSGAVF